MEGAARRDGSVMEGMKCEEGGRRGEARRENRESGVALRSPADAPSVSPSSFPSFCAQRGSSLFGAGGREGEAGRQSVMSCQQCSDGSLTYFRKYHRIAIYNRAEQHGSSHVPGGPEHTQTFSNLKCFFITR